MSHSLRVKIKGLQYKGIITDKDCDRLCKALDNESVLDKIRAEIWDLQYDDEEKSETDENMADAYNNAIRQVIEIIDKHMTKNEADKFDNLDSMLEDLWNAGIEDRQYGFIKK